MNYLTLTKQFNSFNCLHCCSILCMVRIYSILFFVLLVSTQAFAGKKVRVLFLGNSYTYVNNMPQIVADMAASTGDTLEWEMEAPGGFLLSGHYTSMASKNKIKQGNWDYVVLQEQSQHPALPYQQVFNTTFAYAHVLDTMINYYNPCGETIFYMTWGRKNGDAANCATYTPQGWPHFCTYLSMDSVIRARYETIANDNQGIVSPAGAVWRVIRLQHPNIELYDADESHPSMAGSYAAACAFYTAIFRKDPAQVTFNATLGATVAADIRAAAKKVVYDSLTHWHIGQYRTEAAFSYAIGAGNAVSFTNKSANGTSYNWSFGDGQTSSTPNPSHTYNDSGTYIVRLITTKGGCSDTAYSTVYLATAGIGRNMEREGIIVAPNPATDKLYISSRQFISGSYHISITNAFGQVIKEYTTTQQQVQHVDVTDLVHGMYFLTVSSGGTPMHRGMFVKQ
jgi:hypothetical protein